MMLQKILTDCLGQHDVKHIQLSRSKSVHNETEVKM
jgi:hypothetical protein